MNIVSSIADHELQMAHRWFDWAIELGAGLGHHLYLIPAAGLNIKDLVPKVEKAFNSRFTVILDDEGEKSDWQKTEPMRSAAGPNSSFRQIAWYFYHNKKGPYFWCEMDCIPLTKDAFTKIEHEYTTVAVPSGKQFMGAYVELESVPVHMSGNAVYPTNIPELAPTLVIRTEWTPKGQTQAFELAFDIAGAKETVPKAHFTNLIQHKFRHPGFKSRQEFDDMIDPNAVVFHSCKDGSIYQYLRENLSGGVESGHTDLPCKHGELAKGDLMASAHSLVQSNNASGSSAPPAQTNLTSKKWYGVGEGVVPIHVEPIRPQEKGAPTVQTSTFGSDELQKVIEQNSFIKNGLPAMSPPWENREDSEKDVKMLCDALALFCKSPIYKGRVRQALRYAKIIK